jgi:hypothetical protein
MGRDETHDAACKWAFRKTFRRSPTPGELRDYMRALDEHDRLGLRDALPIFSRLRREAGAARTKAFRPKRGRPASRPRPAAAAERQSKNEQKRTNLSAGSSEALTAAPPPRIRKRALAPEAKRARALLRRELGNGPKPSAHVEAAAQEAEISKPTLIAAADALGMRCQRGEWRLPG